MIRATRRDLMAGALAVPAAASLAKSPRRKASGTVLLHDASLMPTIGPQPATRVIPIEGDAIRFARKVFAGAPALVVGVSRAADAVLIADAGREAGYVPVTRGGEALRKAIAADPALAKDAAQVWMLAPRA